MSDAGASPSLFPLFLKLEGKRCLIVGAGPIGLEKVESLLRCGPRIDVIAPEAVEVVRQLHGQGRIAWSARVYEPGDVVGYDLVIAATNDREVNRAVFEAASHHGILCNTADDPPLCDFFFGLIVQRGSLQIAISTAGESPAVAQQLRRDIDSRLPADFGQWLGDLGQLRREVLEAMPAGAERKALLHELAHREVCALKDCPARSHAVSVAAAGVAREVSP